MLQLCLIRPRHPSIRRGLFRSRLLRAVCLPTVSVREIGRAVVLNGVAFSPRLSLNLLGIKSAVKPNWKTNGLVQWEADSINPHLMRQRKAEAETGEFTAVREVIHYLSREEEQEEQGWMDG